MERGKYLLHNHKLVYREEMLEAHMLAGLLSDNSRGRVIKTFWHVRLIRPASLHPLFVLIRHIVEHGA